MESKSENYKEKIYIDGLNYMGHFFDMGSNHWDLDVTQRRVKLFCDIMKNQQTLIKVFIDGGQGTDETLEKYKERQNEYIKKADRKVPYNLSDILGNAFVEQGVEVFYSIEDNDDTLAYYAYVDGATILSRDNDMWRYIPQPKKVYKDFAYGKMKKRQWIKFHEATKVDVDKEDMREIFSEAPPTNPKTSSFSRV